MSSRRSETWSCEYLHSDGNWYASRGGPDEGSAQAQCTLLWRQGAMGVRKVVRRTEIAAERVRRQK